MRGTIQIKFRRSRLPNCLIVSSSHLHRDCTNALPKLGGYGLDRCDCRESHRGRLERYIETVGHVGSLVVVIESTHNQHRDDLASPPTSPN